MIEKSNKRESFFRIPYDQLKAAFVRVLTKHGFDSARAETCARLFADNSLDGVSSHGVNRFPRFIYSVKLGHVRIDAVPVLKHRVGAIEQWDGCLGPGPLNALFSTNRAIELSKESGIGCVALANTNHWMRGGTYAWQAAKAGAVFIGWSNTIANMPAWGATDCRLGNNPIVIGVPFESEAIVLDMAMSQFSLGTLETQVRSGSQLRIPGGYDTNGRMTTDPLQILKSKRVLPMGFWKGSGMALLLDIVATLLSGGLSTTEISSRDSEYALSQVFVAFDVSHLAGNRPIADVVKKIIADYHKSVPESAGSLIRYPGERVVATRKENMIHGIAVSTTIWEQIQQL
jgi:3-dehydro-L-gulonate 2-dehydrogenase